jgi:hypothetical protein
MGEQLKFHVGQVERRTTTCFVTLGWPSPRDAHADFKAALGAPNRAECHERLMLPDDANNNAPAEGILVLDSGRQGARAGDERSARRGRCCTVPGRAANRRRDVLTTRPFCFATALSSDRPRVELAVRDDSTVPSQGGTCGSDPGP